MTLMTGHYPSKQKHREEVKLDGHYSCRYKKGYERKETRLQVDFDYQRKVYQRNETRLPLDLG